MALKWTDCSVRDLIFRFCLPFLVLTFTGKNTAFQLPTFPKPLWHQSGHNLKTHFPPLPSSPPAQAVPLWFSDSPDSPEFSSGEARGGAMSSLTPLVGDVPANLCSSSGGVPRCFFSRSDSHVSCMLDCIAIIIPGTRV